ncbi:MAG: CRISPR-associated endonuclease Cas1 [Candidatus Thorarchaeota archaeon]
MQTIILEEFGVFLGKKGERFVVKKAKKTVGEFPASEVERIVISSSGASASSAALHLAVEKRVPVVFTYASGRPFAFLTPTSGHGTVMTRRAQYEHATDERALTLVVGFIRGKLMNQKFLLKAWGKSRLRTDNPKAETLLQMSDAIDSVIEHLQSIRAPLTADRRQEIMNVEAQAATHYWSGVAQILPPHMEFSTRVTRGANDPFNMCINYGYGLLYSEVWSAVTNAGLDPFAGFLHVDRPGRPSLVLDAIEEFRQQVVDRPLVALCTKSNFAAIDESDGLLDKATRETIASAVIARLADTVNFSGVNTSLKNVIRRQSWRIAKVLRGEAVRYDPFVLKW